MARIQLSIIVSGLSRLFADDLSQLLEMAKIAAAVGIDQLLLPDHLAIGRHPARSGVELILELRVEAAPERRPGGRG